jgi:hypothetical protein
MSSIHPQRPSSKAELVIQKKGIQNDEEKQFDFDIFQTTFSIKETQNGIQPRPLHCSLSSQPYEYHRLKRQSEQTQAIILPTEKHQKIRKRHKHCNDGINAQG